MEKSFVNEIDVTRRFLYISFDLVSFINLKLQTARDDKNKK